MTITQIKQWLNEADRDAAVDSGFEVPVWSVTPDNLVLALTSVGISREQAIAMFTDMDVSYRLLAELTENFEDQVLELRGEEASLCPWNNSEAYNWRGYAKDGNIRYALILLVLCVKCYPEEMESVWDANHWFYVDFQWQHRTNGIPIPERS